MIGAYGQDDRVCAYAELRAILDLDGAPERTAVCILADKEEIGSDGVSGMQSQAFEAFMADLCEQQDVALRHCFARSFCLSADVCAAFDPSFPEVSAKRTEAKLNYGMGICKFTGARGKSGTSDASAELVAYLRRLFADNGVVWQLSEMGKVDQGGGGTIAAGMATGLDRSFAVRFSFLMSLPAVLGANILSLAKAAKAGIDVSLLPAYLAGMLVAMVSGVAAIGLVKRLTSKGRFGAFSYYCWGAGALTLILSLIF